MNITAIKDQVIVLPDKPAEQIGSIHVPETVNRDNPNYYTMTGVVVGLGRTSYTDDGEDERPFDVQVGDRVLFNRYAGKQVTCLDDGVLYLVMHEHEIFGVVEGAHEIRPGYMEASSGEIQTWKTDPFGGQAA